MRDLKYLLLLMRKPLWPGIISRVVENHQIGRRRIMVNYNFYSLELMARDVQNDRQREAATQQRYLKAVKALRTAKARTR